MPTTIDTSERNSFDYDQTPNYQNTYRLESLNSLKIDSIDEIVKTTMSNRLEDFIYDETTAPALCTQVAQEIKKKIIKLDFDRYKLLVIVTMIEKASQSLEINAGFLWDIERDNYSTYTYDNNQTFTAYCLIIATYFE
ncbi:hypothetical protein HCN44_011459 [Aphidius gifuensis]|uniref:Uncharacterized protein n=1 Tax=Aphidius gifuensis TaxID=684658 RepID=A0A835CVB0_APHGI|nr:dynein light chain Tctex-type 5-like [Aphidius gifuensis]KAF7994190.1 hypothetical protein HCN44_011459 [Aphidius gifuensis]